MKPLLSLVLAAGAGACAASPALNAARRGDNAALHDALATRQRVGDLSTGEAVALARAVADRDLRGAVGGDAVDRVRDVRPCAHELDDSLARRMLLHDAAGAAAALARIDGGGFDLGDARRFVNDADGGWRAVGARALVRPEDRDALLRALLDPVPLVRREAARAARDAKDPADLAALAEAARVDPEPIVRTEAVRAIAALPAAPGGRVADTLRDLWTSGDDGLREDIALAWSTPAVWSAGGREALRVVVASGHGPGVVEGAAAILGRRDRDTEIEEVAVAVLSRAIEIGPERIRAQALAQAPVGTKGLLVAARKADADDDLDVRVAALAWLARARADDKAIEKLEGLAQPGSAVADHARFALANLRDRRVQSWIEQDLGAPRPEERLGAATSLAALGVASRAAPLLADPEPTVRSRAACTMIMAARVAR